jgi:hypothetical protein
MKLLTKAEAWFVLTQVFGEGFHLNVIKPWRGKTLKGIHYSPPDERFVAYTLSEGCETWGRSV